MGPVETKMLEYIKARLEQGALAVPADEIISAIIPIGHPEYRLRPQYRYGLERLLTRHVINAAVDPRGKYHYFIGDYPSAELRKSLADLYSDED